MSIWWALLFMTLGGSIVWGFDRYAWHKYYEGRREADNKRLERRL